MSILVTYATKYGATRGVAERIAQRLTAAGHGAEVRPINEVGDPGGYDAYVIGALSCADVREVGCHLGCLVVR